MSLPVLLLSMTDLRGRTVAVQYGHLLDKKEFHFPFAFCPQVDERSEISHHYSWQKNYFLRESNKEWVLNESKHN